MRDYGKLSCEFWTSTSIRALSDDAKMLAAYLLTNQHGNLIGCYRLPDGYVCDDLGWTLQRVTKGLGELLRNGFITVCEQSKYVRIVKYLVWNPLENPNQVKAAVKLFEKLPDSLYGKAELAKVLNIDYQEPLRNGSETVSKPVAVEVEVTVKGASALPEWVPADRWAEYLEMRKKIRKPATARAEKLVIAELEKLKAEGQNIGAVLDQSVRRNWIDVYAIKGQQEAAPSPWAGAK